MKIKKHLLNFKKKFKANLKKILFTYYGKKLKIHGSNLRVRQKEDIFLLAIERRKMTETDLNLFLDHYRKLGVTHFFILSDKNTEIFTKSDDLSLYQTTYPISSAKKINYQANYILSKHCKGYWCVMCYTDEFLTYHYDDTRSLNELTQFLSSIKEETLAAIKIPIYGNTDKKYHFIGYEKHYEHRFRRFIIKNTLNNAQEDINRIALCKCGNNTSFIKFGQIHSSLKHNQVLFDQKTSCALLSINNTQENNDLFTHKYEGWESLAKDGLINQGEWSL